MYNTYSYYTYQVDERTDDCMRKRHVKWQPEHLDAMFFVFSSFGLFHRCRCPLERFNWMAKWRREKIKSISEFIHLTISNGGNISDTNTLFVQLFQIDTHTLMSHICVNDLSCICFVKDVAGAGGHARTRIRIKLYIFILKCESGPSHQSRMHRVCALVCVWYIFGFYNFY